MKHHDDYPQFPKGFVWGAATAAYQIEGAWNEGGRGESIWDRFSHTEGKILHGNTGDQACDHYHRWRDDIAIMKEIGIDSYRFSVSWPRVIPDGSGAVNTEGLEFYCELAHALRTAGITPAITLYHWDLPQALQDRGGWLNRETCEHFARYARIVFKAIGKDAGFWITHNEPWVAAFLGHATGHHAPGIQDTSGKKAFQVAHHLLLSHGLAVKEYRMLGMEAPIGITLNMAPAYPEHDTAEDHEAAELVHLSGNDWFAHPVCAGGYPAKVEATLKAQKLFPETEPGDMDIIGQKIDFLGINSYFRQLVHHDAAAVPLPVSIAPGPGSKTNMGWEVHPPILKDLLLRMARDYPGLDLYITENGASYEDTVETDARSGERHIHDADRQSYIEEHLFEASTVFAQGVPFKGYFVWSLLDNFEWAFGYDRRFGIVHVDFATQERTLKDSAHWYKALISHNKR